MKGRKSLRRRGDDVLETPCPALRRRDGLGCAGNGAGRSRVDWQRRRRRRIPRRLPVIPSSTDTSATYVDGHRARHRDDRCGSDVDRGDDNCRVDYHRVVVDVCAHDPQRSGGLQRRAQARGWPLAAQDGAQANRVR